MQEFTFGKINLVEFTEFFIFIFERLVDIYLVASLVNFCIFRQATCLYYIRSIQRLLMWRACCIAISILK